MADLMQLSFKKSLGITLTKKQLAHFWEKVDKQGPVPFHKPELGECWTWTGNKRNGYGLVKLFQDQHSAHRISYLIAFKTISEAKPFILHKCDNPSCLRPTHLFAGNYLDNSKDKYEKGRANVITGDMHYSRTNPEKLCRGDRHYIHLNPEIVTGENNPDSRLTEQQVRDIREEYALGETTARLLGKKYGISKTAILFIIKRKLWRHVK